MFVQVQSTYNPADSMVIQHSTFIHAHFKYVVTVSFNVQFRPLGHGERAAFMTLIISSIFNTGG